MYIIGTWVVSALTTQRLSASPKRSGAKLLRLMILLLRLLLLLLLLLLQLLLMLLNLLQLLLQLLSIFLLLFRLLLMFVLVLPFLLLRLPLLWLLLVFMPPWSEEKVCSPRAAGRKYTAFVLVKSACSLCAVHFWSPVTTSGRIKKR